MNEETKFSVGDQVEWCGARGKVVCVSTDEYPIECDFYCAPVRFKADGKFQEWHTEPSLKLISKSKKKRKVKLYAFLLDTGFIGNELRFWDTEEPGVSRGATRVPELDKEVEIDE